LGASSGGSSGREGKTAAPRSTGYAEIYSPCHKWMSRVGCLLLYEQRYVIIKTLSLCQKKSNLSPPTQCLRRMPLIRIPHRHPIQTRPKALQVRLLAPHAVPSCHPCVLMHAHTKEGVQRPPERVERRQRIGATPHGTAVRQGVIGGRPYVRGTPNSSATACSSRRPCAAFSGSERARASGWTRVERWAWGRWPWRGRG
jgi:hypothetical protein